MARIEDLSRVCLVIAADEARWRAVLEPAVRAASAPGGEALEPVRVDPGDAAGLSRDDTLDVLELGAAVVVDLEGVGARLFSLVAWHARARPRSVVLLRPGHAALPHELHQFAVRGYDVEDEVGASSARRDVALLATLGAMASDRSGPGGQRPLFSRGNAAARRRREKSGVAAALRRADRALLDGDRDAALEAVSGALAAEPAAPDLLLRTAVLHRRAARWKEAQSLLARAVAEDPDSAPAWRELGVVRDRAGVAGAAEALGRAVDLDGDYAALVSLSFLLSRRGETAEAKRCLDRAIEASGGQLNLVLPALVLRAAVDGAIDVVGTERVRVREVLTIRRRQAEASPPEDAPWSFYDAALASLLLGDGPAAERLVRAARGHAAATWQPEAFARSLDALEGAGVSVVQVRSLLGVPPRRSSEDVPATREKLAKPLRAEARSPSWWRRNVPCATGCPVGTDAGSYVSLVAQGRFADAYRVARGPNPFASVCASVCASPCETACRRGRIDEPVAIRAIKRFLTERHGPESADSRLADVLDGSPTPAMEGPAYASHLRAWGAGSGSPRRVAIVGGGPAGLACAHDLAFLGHKVTVFEASDALGGMMRHGIPDYRLPRGVLDAEVAAILDLGVDVRLGAGLNPERTLASLLAEGFEAVFLASGAGRGRALEVEGASLDGVVRAIDFLVNVNNGFRMELGRGVVVMGGGNVAIDVARTARLGRPPDLHPAESAEAPEDTFHNPLAQAALRGAVRGETHEVHVVARQPLGEWPAQRSVHGNEEIEAATKEGVVFHPLRGIRRILGQGGRVTGVELAEVVRLHDDAGRYAPLYGGHAAETIPCDTVLLAVGQEPDLDYLAGTAAVERTPGGLIRTDPDTLATSLPGVYAGGDVAFGPRTLIDAIAEGKRAARSIHARFAGAHVLPLAHLFTEVHPREARLADDWDSLPREEPPVVELPRRTGIARVEGVYDEATARRQASRCLSCDVQTMYDGSLCIACGRCTDVCPYTCLSLVPADDVEIGGAAGIERGEGARVAMLKDEDLCVRCGLCAERCPTGAMTMERYDMKVAAVPS